MSQKLQMPSSSLTPEAADNHINVDELVEDYAWRFFKDMLSLKKSSNLEAFKHLEREEVIFNINRKCLVVAHEDAEYSNIQLASSRPSAIFKSVFTNNTNEAQAYSLKTERTTESVCGVAREKGFAFGAEAELTIKTPGDIAELKTGFKYETHFNTLTENIKSESLSWGVDNNIIVPAGGQIEASVVIEELTYGGGYNVNSTLTGMVTVSITRIKDGALVLPVTFNIATMFQKYIQTNNPKLKKGIVTMDGNKVKLNSKGTCHFQFALKQYVELNEVTKGHRTDLSSEMARINLLSRH